jgi:hypothetical protein
MTSKELINNEKYIKLAVNKIKNLTNLSLKNKNLPHMRTYEVKANNGMYNKTNNNSNLSNKHKMSIYLKGLKIINKYLTNIISNWKGKKTDLFKLIENSKIKTIKNPNQIQLKKNISSFSNSNPKYNNNNLQTTLSDYNLLIKLNQSNNTNVNSSNKTFNYDIFKNFLLATQPYGAYASRKYIKDIAKFKSNSAYSLSKNYNYKFNKSALSNNKLTNNLYTFLESSFYSMSCLISKPIFIITPEKVIIQIFYYKLLFFKLIKKNTTYVRNVGRNKIINIRDKNSIFNLKINNLKLKIISQILARYFKKSIDFELIKLNNPYNHSKILVKLLGLIINKTNLRKIKNNIFKGAKTIDSNTFLNNINSNIPSYLAGVKIRVAGRLLTQRVIPRKTVKIINKGALARSKVIYLDSSRFTNKNKRGAFSITVFTGHVKY